jgi:DNA-binding cell septation regulator SpoVG
VSDSKTRTQDQASATVQPIRPQTLFRATRFHAINKGVLVGFFDLTCQPWGLVIHDCKLFRTEGREWIGMPSVSYKNRDGKTVWKNIVELPDRDASEHFQQAALRAVRRMLGNE